MRTILALALPLLLAAPPAHAGDSHPAETFDHLTLANIHLANLQEIEAGELGVAQAANVDVKDFAQLMIDQHGANDAQVRQLAVDHGFSFDLFLDEPAAVAKKAAHAAALQALQPLRGAAFDVAFMEHMITAHEAVVAELEAAIPTLDEANVKAFVETTLHHVKGHLAKAKSIRASL